MPTPEELEDAAARQAVAGLKRRLEEFSRKATETWTTLDPAPDLAPRLGGILADQLRQLDISDITEPVQRASGEAVEQGVTDARARLRLTSPRRRVMAPIDVIRAVMDMREQAQEELDEAARLLRGATGPDDLQAALARARGAVTRTERTARWAVNRSLSEGVRAVTDEEGVGRLWIPERDACLRCLAYAGLYVGPGEAFPGGLTFDTRPLRQLDPVPDPPLHPNCRCRTIPWRKEWGEDYPEALKREAQRSVLRGWSVPSESERARLRAADALLKRTALPKSVQDYARKAVARGEFPRGRAFPRPGQDAKVITRRNAGRDTASRAVKAAEDADPLAKLAGNRKSGELSTRTRPALDPYYARTAFGWDTGDPERNADVRFTNPNYAEGREWQVNCQRVVVAYELRRRGYLVEAMPNPKNGNKQYTQSDLEGVWKPEEGGQRRFMGGRGAQGVRLVKEQVKGWPPGARGWVTAQWKTGGAHIWNVEVGADGTVHYIDAQMRVELKDGQPHFRNSAVIGVMRVDDLTPTAEQVTMVKPAS